MKYILLLFVISSAFAQSKTYNYKSYDEAFNSLSYIKFEMQSTKAGLITTSFTGVSKKFLVRHSKESKRLSVELQADSLDTDIDARNTKMHEESLSIKTYPTVKVELVDSFKVGKNKQLKAKILVRGKLFPIKIDLDVQDQGDSLLILGTSNISIKTLLIPDPSIWIATVRDRIDLKFQFNIPKN